MSYVPPALRRKQQEASKGEKQVEEKASTADFSGSTPHFHSLKDIQKHFWPNWVAETPALGSNSRGDYATVALVRQDPEYHSLPDVKAVSSDKKDGSNTTNLPAVWKNPGSSMNEAADESNIDPMTSQRVAGDTGDAGSGLTGPACQSLRFNSNEPSLAGRTHDVSKDEKQRRDAEENRIVDRIGSLELESVHPHNTLNSTEKVQDSLQYVLLFHDANPRWPIDNIIYVKSALNLLPALDQDKEKGNEGSPLAKHIMIFEQRNIHRTVSNAMFVFIGYFNLVKMEILEPQTPALIRMQEQKWTRTDKYGRSRPINRNAESWKKSLTQRWAVLKFEKDEEATQEIQPPQIKNSSNRRNTNDNGGQDRKSVNEMLMEMRMKDGT